MTSALDRGGQGCGGTFFGLAACLVAVSVAAAEVADTTVLKWRDGKQAVFLLAFDDSCPSHLDHVISELEKRGLVGDFYVNPGSGSYLGRKGEWEQAAKSSSVLFSNHTFTHVGAEDLAQADDELTKANEVIRQVEPDLPWPRLIAFGQPGGVPWKVVEKEFEALLQKHHLVDRPPFSGPPVHQKSAADLVTTIDQTLENGEMGHLDFHGVGGDWLVTPLDWFSAALDKLEAEKDRLWITNFISYHTYKTARETAEVEIIKAGAKEIRLKLKTAADPAFYNHELTLETRVPEDWHKCEVEQGGREAVLPVRGGIVHYEALQGDEVIRLVDASDLR